MLISLTLSSFAYAKTVRFDDRISTAFVYSASEGETKIKQSNRVGVFHNNDKAYVFNSTKTLKNPPNYYSRCSRFEYLEKLGWVCSSLLRDVKNFNGTEKEFPGKTPATFTAHHEKKSVSVKTKTEAKAKQVDPEPKTTENKKNDRYSGIRNIIEEDDEQVVYPGKRVFITLSKNYISRINSKEKITKVIFPHSEYIQLDQTDYAINIKFGSRVPDKYIVDIIIECKDIEYVINAAVDSSLPSQIIHLKTYDNAEFKKEVDPKYDKFIKQASALPDEIKIAKILKRVYSNDLLSYWGRSSTVEGDVIKTSIDDIFVLDKMFDHNIGEIEITEYAKSHILGNLIAYGKVVTSEGHSRVLFLYQNIK